MAEPKRAAAARSGSPPGAGPEGTAIVLDEALRIADAAELATRLRVCLSAAATVTLDASGVELIDTATLQLLGAFARDARRNGVRVLWLEPSAAVMRGAELLDLTALLGLEPCARD